MLVGPGDAEASMRDLLSRKPSKVRVDHLAHAEVDKDGRILREPDGIQDRGARYNYGFHHKMGARFGQADGSAEWPDAVRIGIFPRGKC